jgi:hypothetical protein
MRGDLCAHGGGDVALTDLTRDGSHAQCLSERGFFLERGGRSVKLGAHGKGEASPCTFYLWGLPCRSLRTPNLQGDAEDHRGAKPTNR